MCRAISLDLARFEVPEYYNMLHLARSDASNRPLQIVQTAGQFTSSLIKLGGMVIILASFSTWILPLIFLATLPVFTALMRYQRMIFHWVRSNAPDQRKAYYYDQLLTDRDAAAEIRIFDLGIPDTAAMIEMMDTGLTDWRLAYEEGKFDHPELCVPHGHDVGGETILVGIPAVGSNGHADPLATFEDIVANTGASVAHDLTDGCTVPGYANATDTPATSTIDTPPAPAP